MTVRDLVVKTGTYTDSQGNERPRYETIGKMMEGKDGPYLLLKRTFNPAGVPAPDGRDMITVSVFEQREPAGRSERPARSQARPSDPDDIPF